MSIPAILGLISRTKKISAPLLSQTISVKIKFGPAAAAKRKKTPASSSERRNLVKNFRFTGDLNAMPPGGPRGRSRAKMDLKCRERIIKRGIMIIAARINRGLSKLMLKIPPY